MKKGKVKKIEERAEEGAVEPAKDKYITVEELAKLGSLQHKRDMEIQQLGLNTYAWQMGMIAAKSNIDNLTNEQTLIGKQILYAYGCDSDKENFTIDLQTGKILVVKG